MPHAPTLVLFIASNLAPVLDAWCINKQQLYDNRGVSTLLFAA